MAGLISMVCPGGPYNKLYRCSGQPRAGGITIICQGPDHHGVIVQYWMLIP